MASGHIVKGAAELNIAKHRNGSQGRVQLKFIGECTKFKDEDAQNRQDEPPMPVKKNVAMDDEPPEMEQEPPHDDVPPPEPPAERISDVKKAGGEDLPF
jgi:hypothetical protein